MYIGILIYVYTKKKGDDKVSPRTGRPTDNPKKISIPVRLSDDDIQRLEYCSDKTGKSKAEIIRIGIEKVYNEIRATETLDK